MKTLAAILIAIISVLIAILIMQPVLSAPIPGSDPNTPTARWYRSLRNPSTGIMCCDVSDCRPTEARFVDGSWRAYTPQGIEVQIPPESVLTDQTHPTGSAVLCWQPGQVLCFVPPHAGG